MWSISIGVLLTGAFSYLTAYFTFVFDGNSIKWGEVLSDSVNIASRLCVPVVLAIWSHNKLIADKKEQKRKDDMRKKQEELEGFREYVHTYISPFIDENELKKDFDHNITNVVWHLNILECIIEDSMYHKLKSQQISFLYHSLKVVDPKTDPEIISKTIKILQILPSLFYLSDQKFKSIFLEKLEKTEVIKSIKEAIDRVQEEVTQHRGNRKNIELLQETQKYIARLDEERALIEKTINKI